MQAIVLTPTRELCIQVTQALRTYAEHLDIEIVAVFGGAPIRSQQSQLRSGAHVVVATVGRMMDLMSRRSLVLTAARYVVLDEADEMLDLGFIEDVEKILRMCPSGRQTALFSATMPPPIQKLAEGYMYDPTTIRITPKTLTVDAIAQAYIEVPAKEKAARLVELLKTEEPEQAIIFTRTKIGASKLEKTLKDKGLDVKALHGDLSQGVRDGVMISFKDHRVRLLVATDIAARGLDIEHVTHVINYDVPNSSEVYVHRIGRTGRVGRTGRAITFVTPAQRDEIDRIERDVKTSIGEWETPEERLEHAPRAAPPRAPSAEQASERREGASGEPRAATRRASRSRRGSDGEAARAERGAAERRDDARQALRQPRRAQRDRGGGPALGPARGRRPPRGGDPRRPRPAPLLLRRGRPDQAERPSSSSTAPSSRARRSGSRSPRAERRRLQPAVAVTASEALSRGQLGDLLEQAVEVDRLGQVAADLEVGGGVGVARVLVGADDQGRGLDAVGAQLAQGVDARTCAASSRRAGAGRGAAPSAPCARSPPGRRRRSRPRSRPAPAASASAAGSSPSRRRRGPVAISSPPPSRGSAPARRRPAGAIGRRRRKVEPTADGRLDRDRAAVQLDQRFRDRQAEAGAADALGQARVAADEALEDVLQLALGDARSVVGHADLHFGTDYPRRDLDRRSFGRVLMRVGKQIHQYLANPVRLDVDRRQAGLDLLASGSGRAASVWARIVRTASSISGATSVGCGVIAEPAGVAAGEVEQVVEQAHQVAAVVEDDLDRLHLLRGQRVALQHQQLGEALDRGQRAAQLVRGGEHELVFEPVEPVALARLQLAARRPSR